MRNLEPVHDIREAEKQLRSDEFLVAAGGIGDVLYFSAYNDEDMQPKEAKLSIRKANRRAKLRNRHVEGT